MLIWDSRSWENHKHSRQPHLLKQLPIKACYSSPLLRALETAEAIARPHGHAVETIEDLKEVNVGQWENKNWPQIKAETPEAYHNFQNNPEQFGYLGGENLTEVQQRVLPAVEKCLTQHLGQAIVVVGHNVVNRALLATLLNLPLSKARGLTQNNCGVNLIRYRNGDLKILTMNLAIHLEIAT